MLIVKFHSDVSQLSQLLEHIGIAYAFLLQELKDFSAVVLAKIQM